MSAGLGPRSTSNIPCTNRVTAEAVDLKLLADVQQTKSLTSGAGAAGARVHTLPERPRDIENDGDFHFAVLGPKCVSDSGKPSAEARRFIDETTGADRPRTYRNAVVLVAPRVMGSTHYVHPFASISAGRRSGASLRISPRIQFVKRCLQRGRNRHAGAFPTRYAKLGQSLLR